MYSRTGKKVWTWVLVILAGLIIGGTIGYYVADIPYLGWLNLGPEAFGLSVDQPFRLSLGIIQFSLGLTVRFNVGGAIGVIAAVLLFRRS